MNNKDKPRYEGSKLNNPREDSPLFYGFMGILGVLFLTGLLGSLIAFNILVWSYIF